MTTRIMGDSTGPASDQIPKTVDMVAGYDTGTPDIVWLDRDWNQFPGKLHVHIDQAYGDTRAVDAHVLVFDFENGAFASDQAEELINQNTSPRPTIYVNRSNMAATIASAQKSARWHGDVWLAFPKWDGLMSSLPPLPSGCRYVAIQNIYAGDYDTSRVLDPTWPYVGVPIPVTYGLRAEIAVTRLRSAGFSVTTNPLRDPDLIYESVGSVPQGGHIAPAGSHVTVNVKRIG
jgi:hypothetical protein